MHVVMRTYSGDAGKKLVDLLRERHAEVEKLLRGVPGFVSYTAAQIGGNGVTITVCKDKAGTDESVKVARDWVGKNAASLKLSAPQVSEGEVVMSLK